MDNLLKIDPADFGLPATPPIDNSEVIRTSNAVPSAALQSSSQYNEDLFKSNYLTEASRQPAFQNITKSYPKELFDKYQGTAAYSPWMNPYADNEKVAAQNWTKWDAVTTGLSGLLDNAKLGGSEYLKGWARAGRALLTLDASYLSPNETERQILAARQNQVRLDNPIYYSPGSEDDVFSRQFLAETLQNTGFTFGTMAGYAAEIATGGFLGKLALKLPKLFKVGAAANSVRLAEATGAINAGKIASKERALSEMGQDLIQNGPMGNLGGTTLYDQALNVASNIPIIGTLADAGKMIRAEEAARKAMGTVALTSQEITRMGVGGLRRAFAEWNFAASEAAIEAGGTYGEIYDDLYKQFKMNPANAGREPSPQELQEMRDYAMSGSTGSYGTNLAVLAIMNRIAFGNVFRKLGVDNKFLNIINDQGKRFFTVMSTKEGIAGGAKTVFGKTYSRGYFGALGHAKDIKKLFGTRVLAREIGRDFVRGLGRVQLAEGIQENIQEGTNAFLKNYYSDIYNGNLESWGDSFKEAVDSQLSPQGFKTFLSGAITGLFVSPVTGAISGISDRIQGNEQHREAIKKMLQDMNNFTLSDPNKVLSEPIRNIKEQVILNRGMAEAAAGKLRYEYFNNKSSALIQQALYAKRTGTFDTFKQFLKAYATEFDAKQFEEATGINVSEFGAATPAEFMGDIISKIDRFSELYDKYNSMYNQFFSIDTVSEDPYAKQKLSIAQAALQDAIHTVAFNEAKAEDSTVRSAQIIQNISSKNKTIGQTAASTFNNIADHNMGELQINILQNEIETLEETPGPKTPETLQLIELKKQELEALTQWTEEAYEEISDPQNPEEKILVPLNNQALTVEKQNRLAEILTKYYTVKNKQNNVNEPVLQTEIRNVITDINDYQKLTRDTRDYVNAVNLLSDPENGLKLVQSFQDARVAAFARLVHNQYKDLATQSGIFEKYITENPNDINQLLNMARSPFATLDGISTIYKHILNINNMVEKANEEIAATNKANAEAAMREIQRIAHNTSKAAPVNMNSLDPADWYSILKERYSVYYTDEDELERIERFYVDFDGNTQITHTIYPIDVQNYFGEDEEIDINNLSREQTVEFMATYEQALWDKANPGAVSKPEASHKKDVITLQTRKLKNLVEQDVLFEGKKGTLTITDRGYVIEFEDGTTSNLGQEVPVEQQFTWVRNVATGNFNLVDISNALTLDMFPGLELVDTSLTEKEKQITGVNENSEVVREHVIEYVDENTIKIDGLDYKIARDSNNNIISISNEKDGATIIHSYKSAELDPYGLSAQYLTLVKVYMDLQNVPADQLEEDVIDEGIALAEQLSGQTEVVTTTSGVQLKDSTVNGDQDIKLLVNNILSKSMPLDIIDIFDRYITPKTRNTVEVEDRKKLFDWASNALIKLHNLDPSHVNTLVKDAIDFLSKRILNPIAKKDGLTGKNKPPRKPRAKKAKTTASPRKPRRKKGEPSPPKNDSGQTIEEAESHVNKVYNKMERETAAKVEELLKGKQPNQFTDSSIKEAIELSKYNPSVAMSGSTQPITKNPFEDDDLINGLNCNM